MSDRYAGPIEAGMVMVAPGSDGEPFRRDLVLGLHPFKPDLVIYEALPCKMRARPGSGVGRIGLCPEINMRAVSRPEAANDSPGSGLVKVEITVTRTYEMDESRVLAEREFEPPPPDAPEDEKRAWLRESFWELCGFDRDQDHVDGKYVWLVDEEADADFWWPRESHSQSVPRP